MRGFPPAPGAPDPVYPPGQFSPWNAPALRAATAAVRPGLTAGSGPETSEPEYSLLAVSDPSADATATQTWAVLDDDQLAGEWTTTPAGAPARSGRDESGRPGAGPQTGPRRFFESPDGPDTPPGSPGPGLAAPGLAAAARPGTPSGYAGQPGYGSPGSSGHPGGAGSPGETGFPGEPGFPGDTELPGDTGYPGRTDPSLRTARPGGRLAARQQEKSRPGQARQEQGFPETPDPGTGGTGPRGSRSEARGRKPRKPRKPPSRARMWLMPLVMMVVVIVLITVAYLHFHQGQSTAPTAASPGRQDTASGSASPTLGPWKHITTRADDPKALSLTELFPPSYAASGTVTRTVQRAGHNCPPLVLGTKLKAAVRKAGCTQVMRASYLSAGQKIMATVGVLNLANVTDAEQAGKATGATAFIKQLVGPHGPTKNLMKGTGLEEAQIKGHYLILTWAEFTNLKAPGSAARRKELDTFSRQLVASTAGISLTSRMVFGKPEIP